MVIRCSKAVIMRRVALHVILRFAAGNASTFWSGVTVRPERDIAVPPDESCLELVPTPPNPPKVADINVLSLRIVRMMTASGTPLETLASPGGDFAQIHEWIGG